MTSPVKVSISRVSDEAKQAVQDAVDFLSSEGYNMVPADAPIDGIGLMKSYYLMNAGETATMFANMHLNDQVIKKNVEPLSWALGYARQLCLRRSLWRSSW